MARSLKEVERDALALLPSDRAALVEHLLSTLDEGEDEDAEEAWLAEAERRYQKYRAGKTKAVPAEQVFAEAEARLARQKRQ
jgi:putative addiction module component (TIGR02574 family)